MNLALIAASVLALALVYLESPLGVLVWAVASVAMVGVVARSLFGRARTGSLWGTTPAILVLSFAAIAPLVHRNVNSESPAWIGVGLALSAVASLGMVEPIAGYVGTQAVNVPGVSTLGRMPWVKRAAQLAIAATPLLLALCAFASLDGRIWLGVGVVVSSVILFVYVMAAVRRRRSRRARSHLPNALAAMEPEFVLYWDAPRRAAYQIAMWLPYLKRLGKPFFVIVRDRGSWREVVRLAGDDVPAVLAPRMADVDDFVVPTLRAAFYTNNAARNTHLVRFHRLTHIQLLHGESDKAPSYSPVTGMYTKIYVAGRAGQERYANHGVHIDHRKFAIVGRPQVEAIAPALSLPIGRQPVVLYAPTWKGVFLDSSYSSLDMAEKLIQDLLGRGCAVIFRPHPLSYDDRSHRAVNARVQRTLRDHGATTGTPHRFGMEAETHMTLTECFNASDAMVADVSSVVGDWLYSLKPMVTTTIGRTPEEFTAEFPLADAGYIITEDPSTWPPAFDAMLGDDPKRGRREELREHYLGAFPLDDYASGFIEQARSDIESTPAIGSHL